MTLGDDGFYWGIFSCFGLAVAFAIAGLAVLAQHAFALKARLDAYRQLPVIALASRTGAAASGLPQNIRDASQLLPRAQRAIVDLQEARDSLERSAQQIAGAAKAVRRFFSRS